MRHAFSPEKFLRAYTSPLIFSSQRRRRQQPALAVTGRSSRRSSRSLGPENCIIEEGTFLLYRRVLAVSATRGDSSLARWVFFKNRPVIVLRGASGISGYFLPAGRGRRRGGEGRQGREVRGGEKMGAWVSGVGPCLVRAYNVWARPAAVRKIPAFTRRRRFCIRIMYTP